MKKSNRLNRALTVKEKEILFSSPLFIGLTDVEISRIEESALPCAVFYPSDCHVVEAGEQFREVGIVTKGTLSVIREGEKRRVIHRTLTAGDFFGVSSLFSDEAPFPTTILATQDTTVLSLTEQDLLRLFEIAPRIARNYICLLTEKIRFLNHRLDSLAGRSAEERVASHLLSPTNENGTLGITKSALASLLGLGRASLYRILALLEEKGLIRAHRDRIEVIDAEGLKLFIKTGKET